jgi:hypothetical protein
MDDFSIIFSYRPAQEVFIIASIAFMLAYLAGFLLVHQCSRAAWRRPIVRHGIPALGAALVAIGYGMGLHWATIAAASAAHPGVPASVSPEHIHRTIDAPALPLIEVREPF